MFRDFVAAPLGPLVAPLEVQGTLDEDLHHLLAVIGDEGKVLQGPVGGRLGAFWHVWSRLRAEPWVVEVLKVGYRIPFLSTPPLANAPLALTAYLPGSDKFNVLQEEVQSMLQKGAIVEADLSIAGFYNRLFTVPKASGGWRPVLDVSSLNKHVDLTPFSMESPRTVMGAIRHLDWMFTIDMKDAYFHVPIHQDSQRYLRFVFEGRTYQFKALCFGLSTAPQVFTRVLAPLAKWLHLLGIRILFYLDDWLILAGSLEDALRAKNLILSLSCKLGLILNLEKSMLVPSQTVTYLGMIIDSRSMLVSPTPKRVANLISLVQEFQSLRSNSAHRWEVLLGHMVSLEKFRPLARLRLRHFQHWLNLKWDRQVDSKEAIMVVPSFLLRALPWWEDSVAWLRGVPLQPPSPSLVIFSDASNLGWGAVLGHREASGLWSPEEKVLHINSLELLAMWKALLHWESLLQGNSVAMCGDNTTALSYIRKQGGTKSHSLFLLAEKVLLWAFERNISLTTQFIPGHHNVLADQLSRGGQVQSTEWTLSSRVCQEIWEWWGTPQIDLFATRRNSRLPLYCSPVLDSRAWGVDAMLQQWDGRFLYAFPPFAMIRAVLNKLQASKHTSLLLIAPWWPQREWFPDLCAMSLEPPRLLPLCHDLLFQPHTGEHHHALHVLSLAAWRLSSDSLGQQASPVRQPLPSVNLVDLPPLPSTRLDG